MADPGDLQPTAPAMEQARARRERLRLAGERLAGAAGAPYPGRADLWWAGVGQATAELIETFADHIAETEDADGLFAAVESEAPRLSRQVAQLRAEHLEIGTLLQRLAATATPSSDGEVTSARELILDVLSCLARHRFNGSDLLYEAYQVDLGGTE